MAQEGVHVIGMNNITFSRYSIAKDIWNSQSGSRVDSLDFWYCLENWRDLAPLYLQSRGVGLTQLFYPHYSYFRDIVVAGAQYELERIRGRWHSSFIVGRRSIRCLRYWRIHVLSTDGMDDMVSDTEGEYYTDSPAVVDYEAISDDD